MLLNEAVNRSHSAAKRSVVHFLQTSTYERKFRRFRADSAAIDCQSLLHATEYVMHQERFRNFQKLKFHPELLDRGMPCAAPYNLRCAKNLSNVGEPGRDRLYIG